VPLLLLINGLPGSGKSTLAARYVADRPLALCLDVDVVRGLLGAWTDVPHEAGLLARRLALTMARVVLGHCTACSPRDHEPGESSPCPVTSSGPTGSCSTVCDVRAGRGYRGTAPTERKG
jgi:hypothetical protein